MTWPIGRRTYLVISVRNVNGRPSRVGDLILVTIRMSSASGAVRPFDVIGILAVTQDVAQSWGSIIGMWNICG